MSILAMLFVLGFLLRKDIQRGYVTMRRRVRKRTGSGAATGLRNSAHLTQSNYGDQIDRLAQDFSISAAYLKALITLEVGGIKPAPTRFEKHVFNNLQKLRAGKRGRYEMIHKSTIKDASDLALKNLATSWGAFQIMGYKCVQLGVKVSDIRGDHSIYWGVKWISEEYGHLLSNNRFKDAFHFHNTGRLHPRVGRPLTYHANYVPNGLKYMEIFEGMS